MNEWKNRTTRLVRDGVKVSVMSYKDTFGRGWFTMLTISKQDADVWHDNLVHILEQMGCTVFSKEIDGKEKAPEAAATALSAEK